VLTACVEAPSIGGRPAEAGDGEEAEASVTYVTNRGVVVGRDGGRRFGNEPGPLAAGRCLLSAAGDRDDARLAAISETPLADVLGGLAARHDRVVVYFHGYYEDFERSCRRAAIFQGQLALDTGFLLFSWPANSTPFTYRDDVRDLAASVPAFLQLLDELGQAVGRGTVSIVAHSLGSRGLVRALRRWPGARERFRDLVLVAADMDRELFLEALPALRERVDQLTILVSERDLALRLSEAVNQSPRLGQALQAPLEGVVIRDVTDIADTHLSGHVYHLRNERVVAIIRDALAREGEPGGAR